MARQLPHFELMVMFYPGDGWTAAAVKQQVGGSVNSPDIDDTCIVRMSMPLNRLNHNIPKWTEKFRTRKGDDKRWYGLRVKEFWPYMVKTYGNPDVYTREPIDRSLFANKRGVIGFKVPFADGSATGHFTLWNGAKLLYGGEDHDYFSISTEAGLWIAPTVIP
jgi:hypothetical protein